MLFIHAHPGLWTTLSLRRLRRSPPQLSGAHGDRSMTDICGEPAYFSVHVSTLTRTSPVHGARLTHLQRPAVGGFQVVYRSGLPLLVRLQPPSPGRSVLIFLYPQPGNDQSTAALRSFPAISATPPALPKVHTGPSISSSARCGAVPAFTLQTCQETYLPTPSFLRTLGVPSWPQSKRRPRSLTGNHKLYFRVYLAT